jgi:2-hydroxy-3-keto-5-methylthiopentenyl-1-phosphate phosphatase
VLVVSDFDGTVTNQDVTNLLWDRYGMPDWRRRLLPVYRAGKTTTLDLMDAGWREIDIPEEELLAYARPRVGLRDGFESFVAACGARGWPVHVVSCGLDWYLRAFLPPHVPFTSYTSSLNGGWNVSLPVGCALPDGADFKVHVLEALRSRHPGRESVFIGDGRNDLPIARETDRVFAVRGSSLARLCARDGIAHEVFDTFDEIGRALLV